MPCGSVRRFCLQIGRPATARPILRESAQPKRELFSSLTSAIGTEEMAHPGAASLMRTLQHRVACEGICGFEPLCLISFAMDIEVTRTYLQLARPEDLNPARVDDAKIR